MMHPVTLALAGLAATFSVPSDSPRHVSLTRYNLPEKGVKKKRSAKAQAARDKNKSARASRRKQRSRKGAR
jgi:hypothetical protein